MRLCKHILIMFLAVVAQPLGSCPQANSPARSAAAALLPTPVRQVGTPAHFSALSQKLAGSNVGVKPASADAVQFVTQEGSDSNDGLSWGSAVADMATACSNLPGGNSSCTAGTGTIYVAASYAGSWPSTGIGGAISVVQLANGLGPLVTNQSAAGPTYSLLNVHSEVPSYANWPSNNFSMTGLFQAHCGTVVNGSQTGKDFVGLGSFVQANGSACQGLGLSAANFSVGTDQNPLYILMNGVEIDFGVFVGGYVNGGPSYSGASGNQDWEGMGLDINSGGSYVNAGIGLGIKSNNAPSGNWSRGIVATDYTNYGIEAVRNGTSDGSNGMALDSVGAGLPNDFLYSTNGTAQVVTGPDSNGNWDIYDAVNGTDRVTAQMGANGNTLIAANGTGAVEATSNGATGPVVIGNYYQGMNEQFLSSAYTNSTTTFANVGIGSFYVPASGRITCTCHLYYQAAAGGGLNIQFTGPASPNYVAYGLNAPLSATTFNNSVATAFATSLGAVVNTASTNFDATVSFSMKNGSTTGTITLQAKTSAPNDTLTIQPGSYCIVQ